jgi:transposase
MWLCGRLVPDHKTIADFRKDSGPAIRKVCAQFITLCRQLGLLATASVAIDGSKFKAVNNRDRNFTAAKMRRRMAQIEESVARYLHQLDSADRQEPSPALAMRTTRLKEKIAKLKDEMGRLKALDAQRQASPDQQISLPTPAPWRPRGGAAARWATTCRSPSGAGQRHGGLQRAGRRRHRAPSDRDP